jgi:FkbM family methyltransferase
METYITKYGKITMYANDIVIGSSFKYGNYWDESTLLSLREYINPEKHILEIGAHVGTSSIIYASFLHNGKCVFAYEPQKNMYNLLVQNIQDNNLQHKIIPHNVGVFCYNGLGIMDAFDLEFGGMVEKRYHEECLFGCNFGGIGLGMSGEVIELTTIDDMELDNIGFIHCDAQGAENFIFSKGLDTITKYRPVILYENNEIHGRYYYDNVCNAYPQYIYEGRFDIKKYCMETLGYSTCIDNFNNSIDTLLIP